jgi:hypothetical protein
MIIFSILNYNNSMDSRNWPQKILCEFIELYRKTHVYGKLKHQNIVIKIKKTMPKSSDIMKSPYLTVQRYKSCVVNHELRLI